MIVNVREGAIGDEEVVPDSGPSTGLGFSDTGRVGDDGAGAAAGGTGVFAFNVQDRAVALHLCLERGPQ